MTIEALQYINECMEALGIPYAYMEWKSDLVFPFFVGEYSEIDSISEDGKEEGTLIVTGTTDKGYLALETTKEKLKSYFPYYGRTAILGNGSGIAVSYSSSFPVPTGEQGLERIQINLNIKEWRVNYK